MKVSIALDLLILSCAWFQYHSFEMMLGVLILLITANLFACLGFVPVIGQLGYLIINGFVTVNVLEFTNLSMSWIIYTVFLVGFFKSLWISLVTLPIYLR